MAVTNTTIDMTWTAATDNVGVVSYHIYQSTDNVVYTEIHSTDGVTYAYTAIGLSEGTKYYFKQTAKDAAGNESLYGNTVTATTGNTLTNEYLAVLDYATGQGYTLPSSGQQTIQNQLVADLIESGVWDLETGIYVLANDSSSDFADINWKSPGTYTLSADAGVTWTPNLGYKGVNPSTDTVVRTGFDIVDLVDPLDVSVTIYNSIRTTSTGVNKANFGIISGNYKGYNASPYTTMAVRLGQPTQANFLLKDTLTEKYMYFSRLDQSIKFVIDDDDSDIEAPFVAATGTNLSFCGDPNPGITQGNDNTVAYFGAGANQDALVQVKRTAIENYMIAIGTLMSSAQVDAYLIEQSNLGVTGQVIDLSTDAQPRTSESDAAVANLISNGNTVITK